jgi:hypothetical protein
MYHLAKGLYLYATSKHGELPPSHIQQQSMDEADGGAVGIQNTR